MKQTKKITVSAMVVALTVVFLAVGAFVEALDLTAAALASVIVMFVFMEVGKPYHYLVWLASSLLCFVFFPQSFVWINYLLIFGIYPILKAYIERAARVLWVPLKLVYFNVTAVLLILASELIFGIPFFEDDLSLSFLGENTFILKAVIYVLLIVAMMVYDFFITVMARFYFARIRPRIEKMLK
jgi:hypothetical protein